MKQFQRKRLAQAVAASLAIGGASLAYANFVEVTENNPFSAITSTGSLPSLVMMDLDNDGDLDAVLFHQTQDDSFPYSNYGNTSVWENTGSASEAAFTQVSDTEYGGYGTGDNITVNPFAGDYNSYYGHPVSAADVDGDGDLDFLGGQENTYSSTQVTFGRVNTDSYGVVTGVDVYETYESGNDGYGNFDNSFYGVTLAPTAAAYGMASSIAAGDLDNDTDVDLIVVDAGTLRQYRNDGTSAYGVFQFNEVIGDNFPLGLTSPYYGAPIVLHDVDDDGDLDLVMGTVDAAPLRVFVNEGSASTADFVELENTSGSIDVTSGGWASPSFADVNGDGRADLIVAELSSPIIMEASATRVITDEQEIRVFLNKKDSSSNNDFLGSLGGASLLAGLMLLFRRRK
ncbi:VCBS repeat-containing protein [Alcanivorax sp. 1008]|uniref:FG-GAP repeat domain-containing protein n=1 Tax=Alcanivorax sp. 1008 TaxID=2816853 RepID=UPI001DC80E82|nr:VCBS repeat-containing protein [Alcanivorax sp. 1008]MCC1496637.1 VCBS repeat-containing protein [Alcanivorax sp. 1008]